MSRGIEASLKAGAQGGGFFGALGAWIGLSAQVPQPHPIFWYRVFGVISLVVAVSCLFLVGRFRVARWTAIASLCAFGGLLGAMAITTGRENPAPAMLAAVLAVMCYRGLKFLLEPRIRDYFNTDY